MEKKYSCYMCGACCIAYDISTLNKPAGVACSHLSADGKCDDYINRPPVCKAFKADEVCEAISQMSLNDKVKHIKVIYGIE